MKLGVHLVDLEMCNPACIVRCRGNPLSFFKRCISFKFLFSTRASDGGSFGGFCCCLWRVE